MIQVPGFRVQGSRDPDLSYMPVLSGTTGAHITGSPAILVLKAIISVFLGGSRNAANAERQDAGGLQQFN